MQLDQPSERRIALRLVAALERTPDALVPEAFQVLWEKVRFIVLYGGRSAAKSWSIARVLLVQAHQAPLRCLCCREIQSSIRESAYKLLADQIVILQLDEFFDVQSDRILGRNGSEFVFEGLRYNASKIRSYEGVDVVWVEESQTVSELSWETLLPTIRKPGSRFFISFNPLTREDPVSRRFVQNPPPNCIAKKVSYRDNPHFSAEAEAERAWLEKTDPDGYRHVWEGFPREVSDALILRGKYSVEAFAIQPHWSGPHHGIDYGFSRDPSAGIRCYIDDSTRTLFIDREYWELGADIDALPNALESAVPGISGHVVYCDNARPESTSYLARNGIPGARSAEKWPGSVADGIAYLRAFSRIVIDPSCKHFLDECQSYMFKTDRLTGAPLPEPQDANNHLIDALRYALSPLIRNLPAAGYFSRRAMLVNGEPVDPSPQDTRALGVFATMGISTRVGSGVGVVYWAHWIQGIRPPCVLGYDIAEMDDALSAEWLRTMFERLLSYRIEWRALHPQVFLHVEEGEFLDALADVFVTDILDRSRPQPVFDIYTQRADRLPPTLDERANKLRAWVNGGKCVKLARSAYGQQATFRSITSNHLLSQVFGYRPEANEAPNELMSAFALGCLMTNDI
jgi:phage terminase large subunit